MPFSGQSAAFVARMNMAARGRLEPLLEPVSFRPEQALILPNQVIDSVHFFRTGFAALGCARADRHTAVALIGPESFTGHALLLGRERSTTRTVVQVAGVGWRMRASDLRQLIDEEPTLRALLLAAVDELMQQIAESAFAAAQLTVEARLARLLLLVCDRLNSTELPLTHDRIALMLGCRRAGVTMSMHLLEGDHAVRATRGRISVLSRERLREIAGTTHVAGAQAALQATPPPQARARM